MSDTQGAYWRGCVEDDMLFAMKLKLESRGSCV